MTENRLLDLVDSRDFRTLFIDELGWGNPDQTDLELDVDDESFTLTQVAGYKGLRIWHCAEIPARKTQRVIDVLVGQDNHERLVIFSNEHKQEWRWPRRAQLGSANAKLLVHEHLVGDRTTHLTHRLKAIELDFDEDLPLVALLDKMRDAFDQEAETASVAAARLMGTLYTELEVAAVGEHEATLLLARLLFLLFGDDAGMWQPEGLFEVWLRHHTTAETLHTDLLALFEVLDTEEKERGLPADSPYAQFRYINGGLFDGSLRLPVLSTAFRDSLIEACVFDWSIISPAVFGSMFQTVKSKDARRAGGEHYTSEENILKTIRPLFLDEYRERLERAWGDKAQLTKLHSELGQLRFLDPACGCGNFLVVAYKELRALELDLIKQRRELDMVDVATKKVKRAQLSLDVTSEIKVTLDHFYGIEIEEWPARIAETAMLLVDHLANQQMALEFGIAPDRLPIKISPSILCDNSLIVDWGFHLSALGRVFVFGNPPYNGARTLTKEKRSEMESVWGEKLNPNFDYVTAWFKKAIDFFESREGRWAFVTTSSVCQGDPVADLWREIFDSGWKCIFAHRSFEWDSEGAEKAGVHASIIGFDRSNSAATPRLWIYPESGRGASTKREVDNINPFLSDHDNYLVRGNVRLGAGLPEFTYGNMANDGNWLTVTAEQYDEVSSDPIASKFLRKYIGSRELIKNKDRWCLWLVDASEKEINSSELLRFRVSKVKETRLKSKRPTTKNLAQTPHLFGEIRHSDEPCLGIPEVSGHARLFLPVRRFSEAEILSNKVYRVQDDDGYVMGVLSSSMFICWMRTVGGRLRADLSFSSFTYNSFPMPEVSREQFMWVTESVSEINAARSKFSDSSLEKLYNPSSMPGPVRDAHKGLDDVIDSIFGFPLNSDMWARQDCLFKAYGKRSGAKNRNSYWSP